MMDLLSLTTTEAVRAVLGISADTLELEDQVFEDLEVEDALELEIGTWLTVSISSAMSSLSRAGQLALKGCAKYTAALLLTPQLLTMTASKQSDGQNEFQRQDRNIAEMKAEFLGKIEQYKLLVLDELETEVTVTPTFFGRASPVFDPVTGASTS